MKSAGTNRKTLPSSPKSSAWSSPKQRITSISSTITSGMAAGSIFAGIFGESYHIKDSHSQVGVILSLGIAPVSYTHLDVYKRQGQGDEVIVQSFTFCASSHPVTYLGAVPVFVDSEKETWNMSPELLEEEMCIRDRV